MRSRPGLYLGPLGELTALCFAAGFGDTLGGREEWERQERREEKNREVGTDKEQEG